MALRTANTIAKPAASGQVPPGYKGTVIMRIKEQKFGPSASGNPMITLKTEIVAPETVKSDMDGGEYNILGMEHTYWVMLNETDSKGKPSDNLYKYVNNFLPMFGFEAQTDDAFPLKCDANPNGADFVGKCFECVIGSRQRKEQKKNSDGSYSPVLDAQGKEIVKGWEWVSQTSDILRKASTVPGQQF